jgi:Fe-Mn family superoxide dismutase
MKNKDVVKVIADSLGTNNESINESLVAQEKQFSLPTEELSKRTKRNHIDLYKDYIDAFNRVSAELDSVNTEAANSNDSRFRSLKIDETYNLNSVYLHELYFANISDLNSEITMDSLSFMKLERDFGTFDAWQRDFLACAQSSRCGWVVTGYNMFTRTFMNYVIDLHSINVPIGVYPVIVMDVWQHAYYPDYLRDVKGYTINMMKQLNWDIIEKRFERAQEISSVLGEHDV